MLRRAISALVSIAAASASYGVLAVLLLVAGARWGMPGTVRGPVGEAGWTQRSRAAFVPAGFFRPELDAATGRSFSWSGQTTQIQFPALRRSRAHRVTLDVRGGRPEGVPRAQLRVAVDGRVCALAEVAGAPSQVVFEIPRADLTGATVTLEASPTYTPGSPDPRALGVIVDQVAIAPVNGSFMPSGVVLVLAGLAIFAGVAGLRLCGLRGWLGEAASAALAIGFTWLLLQDAAFLGGYAERLLRIGIGAAGVGALVAVWRARWPVIGGVPDWSVAAGLVLAVSAVKLGLFWHPLAIVGDGIFQVHRAQIVHGGQYFFTSVTPKPFFEFPYPVALYVMAQPFWNFFPAELDLVRLLRAVSICADALVGVALYGAARRQWNDRTGALLGAVLWPLARAPFEALSNANLTNLFGQSVFATALAGIAWVAAGSAVSAPALVLICALLVVAFLSHFGTVSVGVAMLGAASALLFAIGRGQTRRMGAWVFVLLLAAAAVSWVIYYSHFTEVYEKTWASVATEESDDSSKIVAAPAVKFQRWWSGIGDDYGRPGAPVLVTAFVGAFLLARRRLRDGATLVFLAWILAWAALSALGILTPITLRANLAGAPAFLMLSAVALGTLASRSRAGVVAAVVLTAVVAWDGWRVGVACLQLTANN